MENNFICQLHHFVNQFVDISHYSALLEHVTHMVTELTLTILSFKSPFLEWHITQERNMEWCLQFRKANFNMRTSGNAGSYQDQSRNSFVIFQI